MNTIYTIGHSTRPVSDFIDILKHHQINLLVDIRTVPRSRRVPDYNRETLPQLLAEHNIEHRYMASLGGLRKAKKDTVNGGWRNASFRGYADYMQTTEFKAAVGELIQLATNNRLAIMCAEVLPWRCHRSLVGDALLMRGVEVIDIFDIKTAKPEQITTFAQVAGDTITYPLYEE